ncbi:MAG: outer membrane beta-barrel protein [Thermoanaerobaculia bacterium]
MKLSIRMRALAVVLTALAAPPAVANDSFSRDLGIHGGVLNSKDGKTSLFVGGAQVRLHLLFLLGAELRASKYSDSYNVSSFGSVDVKNTPIQLSAMLYPLKYPGFGLYVLGGGTLNALKLEGSGNVSGSVNENKWCAHAGAGADIKLSNAFLLNVDGRYVFLNVDPQNLPPASSGNYKGSYWTATLGLDWKIF